MKKIKENIANLLFYWLMSFIIMATTVLFVIIAVSFMAWNWVAFTDLQNTLGIFRVLVVTSFIMGGILFI